MPFPDPPLNTAPIADCATAWLYSIDDVHYYSTINCSDPSTTGYGISTGTVITPQGCDGDSCHASSVVVPAFKLINDNDEFKLQFVNSADNQRNPNRPRFPGKESAETKGVRTRLKKFRNRMQGLKERSDRSVDRNNWADYLDQPEDSELVEALQGKSGKANEILAKRYVDLVEKRLNTAILQLPSERKLAAEDTGYSVDPIPNLLNPNTEKPIGQLFTMQDASEFPPDLTAISESDFEATNTLGESSNYIKLTLSVDPNQEPQEFLFRLIAVELTRAEIDMMFLAHEVDAVPAGASPIEIGTEDAVNIKILDRHEHVHVIQVRKSSDDPGDLTAENAETFFMFSASSLAREELIS